jgi:Raf kinase inhibitor-like YbhB/YbcL family protein
MGLEISSQAFDANAEIPREYTGEGRNVSPPLTWSGGPGATRSYALIVDDPDAPKGTFTHWVIYDIPASESALPEGVEHVGKFTDGRAQGTNDYDHRGWDGPMPPKGHGTHHYHFKLFALDVPLDLDAGVSKGEVLEAMEGHVLDQAELVGCYARA